MSTPLRKRVRRSLRSVLVRFAIQLLELLPLRPALWLGGALGRLAYLVAGETRRLAAGHLAQAVPEKTDAERDAIVRGMFVHLGRTALELTAIRSFDAR